MRTFKHQSYHTSSIGLGRRASGSPTSSLSQHSPSSTHSHVSCRYVQPGASSFPCCCAKAMQPYTITNTTRTDAPNTERHGQLRTDNSSRWTDERYLASCSPPCHARVGTDERAGLMVWRKKQRGSRECLSQPRTHTHTQAYTW